MTSTRLALAVLSLSALAPLACSNTQAAPPPPAASATPIAPAPAAPAPPTQEELVKRGQHLVTIAGCNDCHTPLMFDPQVGHPVPMPGRALSGHPEGAPKPKGTPGEGEALIGPTFTAFRAPFGVVYAANLTSDKETGLGSWTEGEFVATMRSGKHRGAGRPVLPPMPWQNLAQASDDDLRAMFAYLQTVPAVKNRVPENEVPPQVLGAMAKQLEAAPQAVR
jgi:hypothetical protein